MKSIKEVSYGSVQIQKLRRIALRPELLATLNWQEGDMVRVVLNTEDGSVSLRRDADAPTNSVRRQGRHAPG